MVLVATSSGKRMLLRGKGRPIHPSAWKGYSQKLDFCFTEFLEVRRTKLRGRRCTLGAFSHAACWPATALGQPRATLRTQPDSLGVGVGLLLLGEEGPHAKAVRSVHFLRPQPVGALGAGNVHRPSKPTIACGLLHTSGHFRPYSPECVERVFSAPLCQAALLEGVCESATRLL